ncbi:hypothetical protein Tco_1090206 [Tanacetum coccineum]|uniref:Uncharacterized protein n=1 Tax=Tanacetum coccineum TaxID=301880 RepID=A0ABQ5I5L9_9ASTR
MHMLTPKLSSYYTGLGKSSFSNPLYLRKAQKEKPCLYNVKYDKNDLVNLFAPESDETIRLAEESRSKLCKTTVKPYDYTKQNSLYELFTPQTEKSHLKYVQSLEKEVDEFQSDKNEFSKDYHLLLQECVSKNIMCSILCSFDSLDEKTELQCLYLEKYQECEDLKTELSKRNENVENKSFNELSKKFAELEQHCISLELSLQHKNEAFQHNRPCKNHDAYEFPNFFKINELKAQLQEKNMVICIDLVDRKTMSIRIQMDAKDQREMGAKNRAENVSMSISPTIDIASRITNDSSPTNDLGPNLSNAQSSSNSIADSSNHPIHLEPSLQELDLLFSPTYDEYFTAGNQSVSNPSALSGNLQKQDTKPTLNVQPTLEPTTPTNVNVEETNTDQALDGQF